MSDECNCPDLSRMRPGEVVQSKPPCPVHDTPELMAWLAEHARPAIPAREMTGGLIAPPPSREEVQQMIPKGLTEEDVRRIVREELATAKSEGRES